MQLRFILLAAVPALLAISCGPPSGERATVVDAEVTDVERFPTPPKRSEPLASGYYPNPLKSDQES